MRCARYVMSVEDAPPSFWLWPDAYSVPVDGVELESNVPTRFFQSLDAYPSEWGRLLWRVQLNALENERVTLPVFRTFYPGIEWNLRHAQRRWFLTAWLRWEGPGPPQPAAAAPSIEGDAVAFCVEGSVFLRCRVDARDRLSIARNVRSHHKSAEPGEPGVISLDDVIESPH